MLYFNIPIVFGLLFIFFSNIQLNDYRTFEILGLVLSNGILLATNGINVAHELGHRTPYFERFLASCYICLAYTCTFTSNIILDIT